MTDNYGSGPHDHEVGADHEQDMTSETEAWQGDQPPVDDFADHAPEETATVSEETEVMGEDSDTQESTPKKASLILPIVAGVGGLLFLGALLYWQFGGPKPPVSPFAPLPPLSTAALETAAPKPTAAPDNGNTDVGNPKPAPEDVAPTTALAPVTDAAPVPSPAPVPAAVPVAAMPPANPASVPTTSAPPLVTPAVPASVVPAAVMPPATAASAPAAGNAVETRLNALSAHVEDLQKSIAQATQQMNQVSNMIAANPSPGPAFEDRLNKIEQQLAQAQHAAPVATPDMSVEQPDQSVVRSKPRAAMKTKHKTVRHQSVRVVHKATHRAAPKKSSSAHWVLRAATPDEAWVATDATSSELRHVQVGDTLTGLGRVLAIHQNGDNWVVEGSQGTVR